MKRFLKTFAALIILLLILVSGVDAALDLLSHSSAQTSLTVYDQRGTAVVAYTGDLSACRAIGKSGTLVLPSFLHRT